MNTKVFIVSQAVLGLLLVAILVTLLANQPPKADYTGCYHHDGNGGWTYSVPCP
jgi:hypothetical protein